MVDLTKILLEIFEACGSEAKDLLRLVMLAVDVQDLKIRYGKLEAVKGISLQIPPGEHNRDYLDAKRDKMGHLIGRD